MVRSSGHEDEEKKFDVEHQIYLDPISVNQKRELVDLGSFIPLL